MISPVSDVLALLPAAFIRRHRVVPLRGEAGLLEVGVCAPPEPAVLRDLAFFTGRTVVPVSVPEAVVDTFLREHVPGGGAEDGAESGDARDTAPPEAERLPAARPRIEGPVVQQVDRLIREAVDQGASDLHLEPYEAFFRVRYRLDGVLRTVGELSLLHREAVVSRLKVLASLDIAEKRRPQDGRIRYRYGERTIDLRLSTLPTDYGEKVVLRILDRSRLALDLAALGFAERELRAFRRAIRLPYGMILVTGPTGSGKTTTLYAALSALNTQAVNITTIEDPIEYNLPGVNQTHVRSDIGFTFAQALRAFLRQDPNVIMVGEVRDAETAEIAVRAALTGHLVLSTLHTNDAPSAVTRLVDMGLEPFLVASSVRLIVAQRLVRRLCPHCGTRRVPEPALLEELQLSGGPVPLPAGAGCRACGGTGYRGRTALFEVMPVSEALAERIGGRAGIGELRRVARAEGMRTLREAALEKMQAGLTTPEEVLRETLL